MNTELSEKDIQLCMDFAYGTMNDSEKQKFEQRLKHESELRQACDEIRQTRNTLQELEENEADIPPRSHTSEPAQQNVISGFFTSPVFRWAAAAAILWMIVIGSAAVTGLNIVSDDDGFRVSLGTETPAQTTESPPQPAIAPEVLEALTEAQVSALHELLETERNRHEQQMEQLFSDFASLVENRRLVDLTLIGAELETQRERTDRQFQQRDLVLNEIIQFVSENQ